MTDRQAELKCPLFLPELDWKRHDENVVCPHRATTSDDLMTGLMQCIERRYRNLGQEPRKASRIASSRRSGCKSSGV